jgi:hypothetical protein
LLAYRDKNPKKNAIKIAELVLAKNAQKVVCCLTICFVCRWLVKGESEQEIFTLLLAQKNIFQDKRLETVFFSILSYFFLLF